MKINILVMGIVSFFFIGCVNGKKETQKVEVEPINISKMIVDEPEGYTLLKNNCYACHSVVTKSHDEIIAPPMIAVKRRYKVSYNSREDFVKAITEWALDPKEENALMRSAVSQFKVMPKQLFKEEDLVKIAEYIYDNDLENPEWFKSHFNSQHPNGMGNGGGRGRGKGMRNH